MPGLLNFCLIKLFLNFASVNFSAELLQLLFNCFAIKQLLPFLNCIEIAIAPEKREKMKVHQMIIIFTKKIFNFLYIYSLRFIIYFVSSFDIAIHCYTSINIIGTPIRIMGEA